MIIYPIFAVLAEILAFVSALWLQKLSPKEKYKSRLLYYISTSGVAGGSGTIHRGMESGDLICILNILE